MRNPSKNTIKRLMRKAHSISIIGGPQYPFDKSGHIIGKHYRFFNEIGAAAYRMSKGEICNREPKGYVRYCKNEIIWQSTKINDVGLYATFIERYGKSGVILKVKKRKALRILKQYYKNEA